VLVADVIEALPHVLEQTYLNLVRRSEIAMAAFGPVRAVFSVVPGQKRLTESGTRRKYGEIRSLHRLANAQCLHILRTKYRDRAGRCLEVI